MPTPYFLLPVSTIQLILHNYLGIGKNLWILIGSDHSVEFEREKLLTKLDSPQVVDFLQEKVGIDVATVGNDVQATKYECIISHLKQKMVNLK